MTRTWEPLSSRCEMKASTLPSGDHLGRPSRASPDVKGRGRLEPSVGASQIRLRYSFPSRSTLTTVKAIELPSGESWTAVA